MNDSVLRTSLLDLLTALGEAADGVLLGGGYGLYLKQLSGSGRHVRTLIRSDLWPTPRATQDLDLILSAEIVSDSKSMESIRATLDQLGYVVISGSEYLQFSRHVAGTQTVKIDLLTVQLDALQQIDSVRADSRRAGPAGKNRPRLHAHPTDGALALNEIPQVIQISGLLSSGATCSMPAQIPHPFSYLLMKFTAYRDRRNDAKKDLGRHHALDVFRIVAMLTEDQYEQVRKFVQRFAENPQVLSVTGVIASDFSRPTDVGMLAMRQHPLWRHDRDIKLFLDALHGIFF